MSGSNEFLWELSCVSNSNWLTCKEWKMIKDVCPHVQAVFTSRSYLHGKKSGGCPFLRELNTEPKWNSRVLLAFLLQEGDAEERKHILVECGHIKC